MHRFQNHYSTGIPILDHFRALGRVSAILLGFGALVASSDAAGAAIPEVVAREESLATVDAVELFRNGIYWWTGSVCSGEFVQRGGAGFIAYTDPRLSAGTITLFGGPAPVAGGFLGGPALNPGFDFGWYATALKGVLLPDCGYGPLLVRDDDAFYYAHNRTLLRKLSTSLASQPGEPVRFRIGLDKFPVAADGVLFATDREIWSYAADLAQNSLTIQRSWKPGVGDLSAPREVLTLPGVALRKFGIAEIVARDGSYFGSELILLAPDGSLYRAGVTGGAATLIRKGVSDFALRQETYRVAGPFGSFEKRRSTILYQALGNPLTHQGNGQLLALDLTPGGRGEFVEYDAGPAYRVTSVAVDARSIFLTRTPTAAPSNADLRRRRAPAEPTVIDPGDPDYATVALDREFRSLRSTGRLVYFAHGNTVQRLRADAPPILLDYEAYGIEVTQGIQNLQNTVPLVAGRSVFVRGYARLGANTTGLNSFGVPARLRVFRSPEVPIGQAPFTEVDGSPFLPTFEPMVNVPGSLTSVRTNLAATFQFDVPAEVIGAGDLRFEFELNPGRVVPETGDQPLANNVAAATLRSRGIDYPTLVFAPMKYGGSHYDYRAHGNDLWNIVARARAMLPVAGFRTAFRVDRVVKPVVTFTGIKSRSFDMPGDKDLALAWLSIARTFDSHPLNAHYVGMFPPETPNFNGTGSRPGHSLIMRMGNEAGGGVAWNAPIGGRVLAHEYSHNLGYKHVATGTNCTTQTPEGPFDTAIPGVGDGCSFGPSNLEDTATSVGFDPLTRTLVFPNQNGDLMSYANTRWTSEYHWRTQYDAYLAAQAAAPALAVAHQRLSARPAGPEDPWLVVHAQVAADAQSAVLPLAWVVPPGTLTPETLAELSKIDPQLPPEPNFRLQVLGRDGDVLVDQVAPPEELSEEGVRMIRRALPAPAGTARIRLLQGDRTLVERTFSGAGPQITLQPPQFDATTRTLELNWAATDPDGDPLMSVIQFRRDANTPWELLASGVAESHWSVPTSDLPGGPAVRIRVLASDGLNTALAESEPFSLPRHEPQVHLAGIADGKALPADQVGVVTGFGYDVDDGTLPETALRWTLGGSMQQSGTGSTFNLSGLPPGSYGLILTGVDSDGNQASQTIAFSVLPREIGEGAEPVLDGLAADAGYASSSSVRLPLPDGRHATVRTVRANGSLFACFTGLPYAVGNSPGSVAGLRIDPSGTGNALAVTAGFAVNERGEPVRVTGSGRNFTVLTDPPPGFIATLLRDQNAWSVEMRIPEALLAESSGLPRLLFYYDAGLPEVAPVTWPPLAILDDPASWAPGSSTALPPPIDDTRELVANGSFEDTQGTFVRNGDGLMALNARDNAAAIPGWTVEAGEVAWASNQNRFGLTSPDGEHFLDVTGYFGPNAILSQTLSTEPGRPYRLKLRLGSNATYPGAGGTKAVAVCVGDSAALFSFTPDNQDGDAWREFTHRFVANAAQTLLRIDATVGKGIYIGLDAVSVTIDSTPNSADDGDRIVNGSFELACPISFAPDTALVQSLPAGSEAIPGWRVIGAELVWGPNGNAFGPSTPFGTLFLDLTGYHDAPPYAGVEQTVTTTPGESYVLSFAIGADSDIGTFAGPMQVEASAGAVSQVFTFAPTGPGNQWGVFAMEFRANAAATAIALRGISSAGGGYLGLDHVSVIPGHLPSPESPVALDIQRNNATQLDISFQTATGRTYAIEFNDDLLNGTWTTVPGSERPGSGDKVTVPVSIEPDTPTRFYRLRRDP